MKLHILGICGTFMGGVAALAKESGHQVSGCDQNVYPPMSTQLEALGIKLQRGYIPEDQPLDSDMFVVGNALSRGNPAVEWVLDQGQSYTSGAQWLAEHVLRDRDTFAVAGTHGKTTTSSMLAYLLDCAGQQPGFLIGGVPDNFGISARLGSGRAFVVEADEYDTAFFDKRSKFVHYRPSVAVLNNLEFDHADIFENLDAIKRQFHHLIRTIPGNGRLIVNGEDQALTSVLEQGCWTPVERFGLGDGYDWSARLIQDDGSEFEVFHGSVSCGVVRWSLIGRHNVMNALGAIAAANAAGVPAGDSVIALAGFLSAKRRMELVSERAGIRVYDDFAHHPTAIRTTLEGLRARVGTQRVIVALEPRSNSMRLGAHAQELAPSLHQADQVVFLHRPELPWDASQILQQLNGRAQTVATVDELIRVLVAIAKPEDNIVFMSNGGFENAQRRFVSALPG